MAQHGGVARCDAVVRGAHALLPGLPVYLQHQHLRLVVRHLPRLAVPCVRAGGGVRADEVLVQAQRVGHPLHEAAVAGERDGVVGSHAEAPGG